MNLFEGYEKYVRPETNPIVEEKKPDEELFNIEDEPGENDNKPDIPDVPTIDQAALVDQIAAKVAEMMKKGEE